VARFALLPHLTDAAQARFIGVGLGPPWKIWHGTALRAIRFSSEYEDPLRSMGDLLPRMFFFFFLQY